MESKIKPKWPIWYFNFLSALVYALAVERKVMANFSDRNHWAELMADSQAAMPDYLVWPVRLSTIILDLSVIILTGKRSVIYYVEGKSMAWLEGRQCTCEASEVLIVTERS